MAGYVRVASVGQIDLFRNYLYSLRIIDIIEGARGVMVVVVGNGHTDISSNPG